MTQAFEITPVRSQADLDATTALFRAYQAFLAIDLCFQDFEAEMAAMPGKYAPPRGELLLARALGGDALGCVALRPLDQEGACEMKRLFVTPQGRGGGVGHALVERVLGVAKDLGYRDMKLDTLPTLRGAVALYRRFGFEPTEPYNETPLSETLYFRKSLNTAERPATAIHSL